MLKTQKGDLQKLKTAFPLHLNNSQQRGIFP